MNLVSFIMLWEMGGREGASMMQAPPFGLEQQRESTQRT